MTEMAPERPQRSGNVFTQKIGPMPMWGWMGVGLAIAMVYYFWQKNKASSSNAASTSTESGTTQPADQVPPYIIQNYEGSNTQTVGAVTTTNIEPTEPRIPGPPPPPPTPKPKGGKPPESYTTVTVVPWTQQNTPWNSTLWGIATHYDVAGGYETLAKLNNISNPNLIYPGQQIKVPVNNSKSPRTTKPTTTAKATSSSTSKKAPAKA